MDADFPSADAPLPDDVSALQALARQLLAELARLRAENAELRNKLDAALKHRFGRRSERRPRRREPKDDDKPGKRRDDHGRSPLPAHLPRHDVVHDLTEAEKVCPCCGRTRVCIGVQTAEQLDLEPVQFFVLRTIRKSYACPDCDPLVVPAEQRLQTAGPPQVGPIAKGLCGPGLLAYAITAKFADHVPVHRLVGQLGRSGVAIACSTLGGWLAQAADLLAPLAAQMRQRVLKSRVIHGDDTGVKLRVPGADRTHKAHLWAYIGDADYPYVVFDFTADHTAAGPERFLAGYKGYLQADALAQYEGLYSTGEVKHCCCWAHARRKFVAAAEAGDERAEQALTLIRQLYAIERAMPALLLPSDEAKEKEKRRQVEEQRRVMRQSQVRPVLEELEKWLERERAGALPRSLLGKAITYCRNNWAALGRYQEAGWLSIDNNLSERVLRAIALGRGNWGVIGSAAGGKTAAVLYSVVATCKHLGIDPFVYLREALPGLFGVGEETTGERLQEWLPDRWLLTRKRGSPAAAG